MKVPELLNVLVSAGIVLQADNEFTIDLTHFNEYGKFILAKAIDPNTEKCPECGKVDHEDCGCNADDDA